MDEDRPAEESALARSGRPWRIPRSSPARAPAACDGANSRISSSKLKRRGDTEVRTATRSGKKRRAPWKPPPTPCGSCPGLPPPASGCASARRLPPKQRQELDVTAYLTHTRRLRPHRRSNREPPTSSASDGSTTYDSSSPLAPWISVEAVTLMSRRWNLSVLTRILKERKMA